MTSPYIETYGITEQEYDEIQTQYENKSIHLSGYTLVRGLSREQSYNPSNSLDSRGNPKPSDCGIHMHCRYRYRRSATRPPAINNPTPTTKP
jgi:hypothetical protein